MKAAKTVLCLLILLSTVAVAQQKAQPGNFDYYLLTLSWSPEFCHSHSGNPQCGGRYGFVVHGLWPQFSDGRWPAECSLAPGLRDSRGMLDIMPDPRLVEHEWRTHGTCSGMTADEYFAQLRKAFSSMRIPERFVAPAQGFSLTPAELKRQFAAANPGLDVSALAVSCGNNYLTAVRICLTRQLRPMACPALRDCGARTIKVTPVR